MRFFGYNLIFVFENLLREYISEKTQEIDDLYINEAIETAKRSGIVIDRKLCLLNDILSYLHLGVLLDIISSKTFRIKYDNDIWKLLNRRNFVISKRNDIMHSRILFEDEEQELQDNIERLLDALKDRKYKRIFQTKIKDNIQPNLCVPFVIYPLGKDYRKLIGRDTELISIVEKLEFPIPVTIAGMGGMGKSAIVLQLIEDIVNSPNPKYKKILFMSFKDKYFDGEIRELTKAINNYSDLMIMISELLDENSNQYKSFEEYESSSIKKLFEEPTLLVLDNLETEIIKNDAQKFIDLARYYPRNYLNRSSLLITSRNGLGQLEDKLDLLPLKKDDVLDLLSVVAEKKVLVSEVQWNWIKKYTEGNPMQIKTLGILLKESNTTLANLIIEYETKKGSLAQKALSQKEAFLSFCFDNTIVTLEKSDQILFTIICEICSKIQFFDLNRFFFDYLIDHLELAKYNIISFEPNNFTRLTLLYYDNEDKNSNNLKINLSALQYISHGRELSKHYNKLDLLRDQDLYNSINNTLKLMKEILLHSPKKPTIDYLVSQLFFYKYNEMKNSFYIEKAFQVNPSLQLLNELLNSSNDQEVINKIANYIDCISKRELNENTSTNIHYQNLILQRFAMAISRLNLPPYISEDKYIIINLFSITRNLKFMLIKTKSILCKMLVNIQKASEALRFIDAEVDDYTRFEVYSKVAEEARKTGDLVTAEDYYDKCNKLLLRSTNIGIFIKYRHFLYYGKYLQRKGDHIGATKILDAMDDRIVKDVGFLSLVLESLIIRAECFNSLDDFDSKNNMLIRARKLTGINLYEDLFFDKKAIFERRLNKLAG